MSVFVPRLCSAPFTKSFGHSSIKNLSSTNRFLCSSFSTATSTTSPQSSPSNPEKHPKTFELTKKTLGDFFDEKMKSEVTQWNDSLRDVTNEYRWTNQEYHKNVEAVANGFASWFKLNERVAVMLGPITDSAVAFLSAAKGGVLPTFLDPDITVRDLQQFVKSDQSKALIFSGTYNLKDHEYKVLQFCPALEYWPQEIGLRLEEFPSIKHVFQTGSPDHEWGGRFFHLHTPVVWPPILPLVRKKLNPSSDCYSILDTKNQQIVFSHSTVVNNGRSVAYALGLNRDRVASLVSYHTYGAIVGPVSCVESDSVLLFPTYQINIREDVLAGLQTEHATVLIAPLADLVELAQATNISKVNLSRLRKVVVVVDGGEANQLSGSQLKAVQNGFSSSQLDVLIGVREGGIILSGTFSSSSNSLSVTPLPHISARLSSSGQLQVTGYNLAHKIGDETKSATEWFTTPINSKQVKDSEFQIQFQQ